MGKESSSSDEEEGSGMNYGSDKYGSDMKYQNKDHSGTSYEEW